MNTAGVRKPSKEPGEGKMYGKEQPPEYADKLDLDRVKELPSFRDFLRALS